MSRWTGIVVSLFILAAAATISVYLWTTNLRYEIEAHGPIAYILDRKTGQVQYLVRGELKSTTTASGLKILE